MIDQFKLGWLVGIIDGEGTISINKHGSSYTPTIRVYSTTKSIITEYCNILDSLDIQYNCYGSQKPGNRKYQWEVSINASIRVYKLLNIIQDRLVCKKKQAYKVMDFIESRNTLYKAYTEEQHDIIKEIRSLNGRGKSFSEVSERVA